MFLLNIYLLVIRFQCRLEYLVSKTIKYFTIFLTTYATGKYVDMCKKKAENKSSQLKEKLSLC